jgi:N4-gp56 family major capsid protein
MATSSWGVNDPLAVKLWSKKLFVDALKETSYQQFIGKTASSLIQVKDETSKGAGDKVTFGLRMQLSGDGVLEDGTLEGNEESLTTYSDSVTINQLRHAVRSAGKMTEKRVTFSVREEAKEGLKDWWSNRLDTSFFNQLCGFTTQSDVRYTGNVAVRAATSNRIKRAGGVANDQSLTATNIFNLNLIDACVEAAQTVTPMLRPITVNGKKKYVMFLHPSQVYDMRTNTSEGQWLDIQKAAMAGGAGKDSLIYTNALGEYNDVILFANSRVTQGVNGSTGAAVANTRRAVFCGAQAGVIAYGRDGTADSMSWVEELFDYENQLGVSAGMIFGMQKTQFNAEDFGAIVVPTFAAPH